MQNVLADLYAGAGGMKKIPMTCPNCGAGLEVTNDLETFACGYCGSSIKVVRYGGTISLKRIEMEVGQIRQGTERIASELALVRLDRELEEVTVEIVETELEQEMLPSEYRDMPFFDYSYPVTLSGEKDYGKLPRHEFWALAKSALLAIAVGWIFGFLSFAVVLTIAWWRILASQRARIDELKAGNLAAEKQKAYLRRRCEELSLRESALRQQISGHRSVVGCG